MVDNKEVVLVLLLLVMGVQYAVQQVCSNCY